VGDGGGGRETRSSGLRYSGTFSSEDLTIDVATGKTSIGPEQSPRPLADFTGFEALQGHYGTDKMIGDDGPNALWGLDRNDALYGRGGKDTLIGGDGIDILEGGDGNDLILDHDPPTYLRDVALSVSTTVDFLVETMDGGEGDDTLIGTNGRDILLGGPGDDMLFALGANSPTADFDTLDGGLGNDTVSFGVRFYTDTNSIIAPLIGTQFLARGTDLNRDLFDSGLEADGGPGNKDTISFAGAKAPPTRGVVVDLETGVGSVLGHPEAGFTAVNFERAWGTPEPDILIGSARANLFLGLSERDTISGGKGKDTIYGGDGRDLIDGGAQGDKLFGDAGLDRVKGGSGADTILGGGDRDTLRGGANGDTLRGGDDPDKLFGEAGPDKLFGEDGRDTLLGGGNPDQLWGGEDPDTLRGGASKDRLFGDEGTDLIWGQRGNDILEGGPNRDTFAFRPGDGRDTIRDFAAVGAKADRDVIDLKAYKTDYTGIIVAPGPVVAPGTLSTIISLPSPGDTILLLNVPATQIDPSDFLF